MRPSARCDASLQRAFCRQCLGRSAGGIAPRMRCRHRRRRGLRLLYHVQCARRCLSRKIGYACRDDLYGGLSRGGRVPSPRLGYAGPRHYCDRAPIDHDASTRSRAPSAACLAAGRTLLAKWEVSTLEADHKLAEHLRDLEERLLQPEVRQAAEAVAELVAEGFIEFGSSGRIYSRERIIEAMRSESPIRRSLTGFKTTMLAPGVVLATYRAVRNGSSGPESSLRSSIWKLIDGRWQMMFHQGTVTRDV